eukprot:TRINITY_DN12978_c1_g2_i1.p1 TRINITY_DN12978_c1_g2~~TRINITY_DN12978_c1_g2_i1.p1  ORF type:complete len:1546 (-),score=197.72 TRINITY_DN12978_c1_g2_i1:351-4988(-)
MPAATGARSGAPASAAKRGVSGLSTGFHVPCAIWPSTYVSQDIECLAASRDGRYLAVSCSSGQVYIWHCALPTPRCRGEGADAEGHCTGGVRLDPVAVALAGWLGPTKVFDLDFCRGGRVGEAVGVRADQVLLVCLLVDGRLRLLDTADGRCVAIVPASCYVPSSILGGSGASHESLGRGRAEAVFGDEPLLRVMEDGRHVALAGHVLGSISIVDVWSNRLAVTFPVPGDAHLLCLQVPRGNGFRDACQMELVALGEESVWVWRWSASERSSKLPFFSFDFARRFGRAGRVSGEAAAVALEGGVLLLGLPGRVLLLPIHGEAQPSDQVAASVAVTGLIDATLVSLRVASALEEAAGELDTGRHEPVEVGDEDEDSDRDAFDTREAGGVEHVAACRFADGRRLGHWRGRGRRRRRSWTPRTNFAARSLVADEGSAVSNSETATLVLVAWTAHGEVSRARVESTGCIGDAVGQPGIGTFHSPVLDYWCTLPMSRFRGASDSRALPCCWWASASGFEILGAAVGGSAGSMDAVHVCSAAPSQPLRTSRLRCHTSSPPYWRRAASLKQLWQLSGSDSSRGCGVARSQQINCSAVFETSCSTWVALGFAGDGGVCVVAASSIRGQAPPPRRLPLPEGFAAPTCLTALGPHFLVAADSDGQLCWWSLPDFDLAGNLRGEYRVSVVHVARVRSASFGCEGFSFEEALVAALDELGHCRIVDLAAGQVRCVLQSQSGPDLWLDEPIRFLYDVPGRYIFASTPRRTWVWDASSGAFEGSKATNLACQDDCPVGVSGSTSGFRCGASAACPSFGLDSVAWQDHVGPLSPIGAESPSTAQMGSHPVAASAPQALGPPPWHLGEVMLDGPLWKMPVILFALGSFVSRWHPLLADQQGSAGGGSGPAVAPPQESVAAGAGVSEGTAATVPWPLGPLARQQLLAQLATLGIKISGTPFAVGVLGVDSSFSFQPPRGAWSGGRRRGLEERSASPVLCRTSLSLFGSNRHGRLAVSGCNGLTHMSRVLLRSAAIRATEAQGANVCNVDARVDCTVSSLSCPYAGLAFVAQLLMSHGEAPGPLLQRYVFPALNQLLLEAPVADVSRALAAWSRVLHQDGGKVSDRGSVAVATKLTTAPSTGMPLGNGAFASTLALRDAAAVLMAAVANVQPWLFDKFCPPFVSSSITEVLCTRMFSKSSGPQLQSLCCEVFAPTFLRWRRHMLALGIVPTRGSAGRSKVGGGAAGAPGGVVVGDRSCSAEVGQGGASVSGPVAGVVSVSGGRASATSTSGNPAGGGSGGSGSGGSLNATTAVEEDLEWLALQALALYQDPRVAPSSLRVLMQVGTTDPASLVQVMGKAARRIDLGATYASSAIFVLVSFIHRFPAKVFPWLPKLTEVVLRCLEPSDPPLRRQSLLAVTSALHELVQTFPMVAFHQPSQKFAVGTNDGLAVVYDLRTATKWRIFEGHTGSIAALAFSRDGDKLSSYSARDSSIRVWQCGSLGFLGGLLGTSGKCVKQQGLPPAGPHVGVARGPAWRIVSLSWTERGSLRLVRENGTTVQLQPD